MLTLFLDCLHEFDPKKFHKILALILDLKIQGFVYYEQLCKKRNNHNCNKV
jgi:hypothetical protein